MPIGRQTRPQAHPASLASDIWTQQNSRDGSLGERKMYVHGCVIDMVDGHGATTEESSCHLSAYVPQLSHDTSLWQPCNPTTLCSH